MKLRLNRIKVSRRTMCMLLLVVFFLMAGVTAFAATEGTDITKVGAYDLDTFSSYMVDSDFSLSKLIFGESGSNMMMSVTNIFYSFNKLVWEVGSFMIGKVYKGAEMDQLIHLFFTFSKNIYDQLYSIVGIGLIAIYVLYVVYLYFVKSPKQAQNRLFRLLLVISFAFTWFGHGQISSHGEEYTKRLDSWSIEVEGLIYQATSGIEGLEVATNSEDAIEQIQEMYYQKAVVGPYLLMNYGTTDIGKLEADHIKASEFLGEDSSEKTLKRIEENVKKAEGDEKNEKYRKYLKPYKGVYKLIVGTVSPMLNLTLGLPMLMIGCIRFIFQLGALLMLVALPFLLILSFFPNMEYLLFKGFKSFVGFIFQKAIYSVLVLLLFLVFNVVDSLIASGSVVGFMVNLIVKGIISLVGWKKRKEILQKLSLGQADAVMDQVKQKANETKESGKQIIKQGVEVGTKVAVKLHPGARKVYQTAGMIKSGIARTSQRVKRNYGKDTSAEKMRQTRKQQSSKSNNKSMALQREKNSSKNSNPQAHFVSYKGGIGIPNTTRTPQKKILTERSLASKKVVISRKALDRSDQKIPLSVTVPHIRKTQNEAKNQQIEVITRGDSGTKDKQINIENHIVQRVSQRKVGEADA